VLPYFYTPSKRQTITGHHASPFERQDMHVHVHETTLSSNPPLHLVVVLLARHALCLALADNALAQPLGREALLQLLEVLNDVATALDDGVLGGNGAVGGDAQLEGREEWVRNLVGGEDNVLVLEEALGNEVAERVVFAVEGEDGRVRDACSGVRELCI
jgi:hypothetical protein